MLQTAIIEIDMLSHGNVQDNFMGEWLHGWWFQYVAEIDPQLATRWHDASVKPFSLWCSFPYPNERNRCHLRVSGLNPEAVQVLQSLSGLKDDSMRLGRVEASVTSIRVGEPVLYSQLMETATDRKEIDRIHVDYVTPVSFRDRGVQEIFPTPTLVMNNLGRRWHAITGIVMPEVDWSRELAVSQYHLESRLTSFRKYKIIGSVGNVTYRILNRKDPALAMARVLFAFSGYAGIGYKTTMGLGRAIIRFGSHSSEVAPS